MSKHTPGPWHWINSSADEPFDFSAAWDGEGYPSLRTVAEKDIDGRYTMPDFILDAEPMQNGNDAANARLIAAAPDLLAALIELRSECLRAGFDMKSGYGWRDALSQADDAIERATGSAQ